MNFFKALISLSTLAISEVSAAGLRKGRDEANPQNLIIEAGGDKKTQDRAPRGKQMDVIIANDESNKDQTDRGLSTTPTGDTLKQTIPGQYWRDKETQSGVGCMTATLGCQEGQEKVIGGEPISECYYLTMKECTGQPNQRFFVDGSSFIRLAAEPNFCMDWDLEADLVITNPRAESWKRTSVLMLPCRDGPDQPKRQTQDWKYEVGGTVGHRDGSVKIKIF